MASAVNSFKEAFSSYMKNIADYIIYSIIASIAGFALILIAVLFLAIIGIMSQGGVLKLFASGADAGIGAIELSLVLLVVLAGFIIFSWLLCGITGAYFHTLHGFLSGRKQTLAGFFGLVPRFATSIFVLNIIEGLLFGIPMGMLFILITMLNLGSISTIILSVIAVLYALLLSLLFIFGVPAIVVHGKKPLDAMKASIVLGAKNIISVVAFIIISMLLAIPSLIPLYSNLIFIPVMSAALLLLYKGAK